MRELMQLSNKTILLISPQDWGSMFLSKHHYALALAERGNKLYFLNPPQISSELKRGEVVLTPSGVNPSLFLIQHRLAFPYTLKYHFGYAFHALMKFHIQKIMAALPVKPDIIWSFDLGNLYPFVFFPKSTFKIFHPVDEPRNTTALNAAIGSDVIFSVTTEILEKYSSIDVPRYFINHGISSAFADIDAAYVPKETIDIGLAGNLLRNDIDWPSLLQIVHDNEQAIFHFWGCYVPAESNIGASHEVMPFIDVLRKLDNVKLHGVVTPERLAHEIAFMDVFLICYDIMKDQSRGTNYHKVMEFLSSGRVIVSNNITAYQSSELIEMCKRRDNNEELPALFKKVIANLSIYNSRPLMDKRIAYAKDNTYQRQLDRIASHLENIKSKRYN